MLDDYVSMIDIDVDHWRNLQTLLLDSARSKRRIVVIHDDGTIRKVAHSEGEKVVGDLDRADDPHLVAWRLYEFNDVDFVFVVERRALDDYFATLAHSWQPDEAVDQWVRREYALLDRYRDGLVTYPAPAREHLGLQWRTGFSYEQIVSAARRRVAPNSAAVFGVFDGDALWASLVVGFNDDHRVVLVTTADPATLHRGGRDEVAEEVVAQVESRYMRCSFRLFTDRTEARELLRGAHK